MTKPVTCSNCFREIPYVTAVHSRHSGKHYCPDMDACSERRENGSVIIEALAAIAAEEMLVGAEMEQLDRDLGEL